MICIYCFMLSLDMLNFILEIFSLILLLMQKILSKSPGFALIKLILNLINIFVIICKIRFNLKACNIIILENEYSNSRIRQFIIPH